jgi:hypothetical protein
MPKMDLNSSNGISVYNWFSFTTIH